MANAVILFYEGCREDLAQRPSKRLCSRLRVHHFHLRVPRLHPIGQIHGKDADTDGLNDILVEFLQPLVRGDALLQRGIESRVLDRNTDVSGESLKQLNIFAGEIVALDGLTHSQNGNGTVLHSARDVIVQLELGNGRLSRRTRVQHLMSVLEEKVSGLALVRKPAEEIELQVLR